MKKENLLRIGAIVSVALLIRVWLIVAHPIVFGGDSVLRLMNRDRILLSYQLPLLQALLHAVSLVTDALIAYRLLMAVIGAVAAAGFFLMAEELLDRDSAFLAAILFSVSPFLVQLSIVPYQEVLELAGLFFAFVFFFRDRMSAASLSLGLACLTRYEAWAACPVLMVTYWTQHQRNLRSALRAVLLFGWAPLLWMAAHQSLSPAGTYVAETGVSLVRLWRYAYLGWITLKNVPPPIWLLAVAGCLEIVRTSAWRTIRFRSLASFGVLFLGAILFSAHGESPDPERFVTAREAHIPIAAAILLAGFAPFSRNLVWRAAAVIGFAWSIWDADRFIRRDTTAPNLQLSYRLAEYLDAAVDSSERAILLTKPVEIESYLSKVERRGGKRALAEARRVLASVNATPPDYQRTVIHSRAAKDRFVSLSANVLASYEDTVDWPSDVTWVARWSDFQPRNRAEEELSRALDGLEPRIRLESGDRTILVYKLK